MDFWKGPELIPRVVEGTMTAADLDSGKVIECSDLSHQVERGDLVYVNWRDLDRWFYGNVSFMLLVCPSPNPNPNPR